MNKAVAVFLGALASVMALFGIVATLFPKRRPRVSGGSFRELLEDNKPNDDQE